jgi:hypothetical protein
VLAGRRGRAGDVVGLLGLRKNLLFLKKKKQKDFYSFAAWPAWAKGHKSFLVLFFKKERACLKE